MNDNRAPEFLVRFPTPSGVMWDESLAQYVPTEDGHLSQILAATMNARWEVWQELHELGDQNPAGTEVLDEEELSALKTVHECFMDSEDFRITDDLRQRLLNKGALRHISGGRYMVTEFGVLAVLSDHSNLGARHGPDMREVAKESQEWNWATQAESDLDAGRDTFSIDEMQTLYEAVHGPGAKIS